MLHDDARMPGTPAREVAATEAKPAAGICSSIEGQAADVGGARVPRGEDGVQRQELSVAVNDRGGVEEQVGMGPSGIGQRGVVDVRDVLEAPGFERCGIADKADLDVSVSAQSTVVRAAYRCSTASQDWRRAGARTGDGGGATPQTLQMALGAEMIAHDVMKEKMLMAKAQAKVDESAASSVEAQRLRKRRKRLEHSKARRARGKERHASTVSSSSKAEATTESVRGPPQGAPATTLDDEAATRLQ
ncbi:uncharacterized protein IUM83_14130 [Phytophthora cinnamomi]|uniref:uncharacterized protein n=1 Tax=Phytophthora cinnamomi TaxID=4785 RepID=UPI00355A2D2E|nr:hypothetical protein IUM83_14130 [Phytophthora cinnamomi]